MSHHKVLPPIRILFHHHSAGATTIVTISIIIRISNKRASLELVGILSFAQTHCLPCLLNQRPAMCHGDPKQYRFSFQSDTTCWFPLLAASIWQFVELAVVWIGWNENVPSLCISMTLSWEALYNVPMFQLHCTLNCLLFCVTALYCSAPPSFMWLKYKLYSPQRTLCDGLFDSRITQKVTDKFVLTFYQR